MKQLEKSIGGGQIVPTPKSDQDLIQTLNTELSSVLINFSGYHSDMMSYLRYYTDSAFYRRKTGQSAINKSLFVNLLKVFADKNIYYTSPLPQMKVPTTPNDREGANLREKILLSTHYKSSSTMIQRKNARNTTLRSACINEVYFDREKRCVLVRSLDPIDCYWQYSDHGDGKISTFWHVKPITKTEAEEKYGVTPTSSPGLSFSSLMQPKLQFVLDSQDWFLQITKLTEKSRTVWLGDKIVEESHNHNMGDLPVEICMPFDDLRDDHFGSFFLRNLVPLQAEFNEVFLQESAIARKMANPTVWGRGIQARDWDDLKKNLKNNGGGFAGVGKTGELGLLQVNDVNLLTERQKSILDNMMRVSGFSSASFGESVGANTSGDALGMYFTPTQRFIEDQNIAWINHWQNINAKILRAYKLNMTINETISLDGYAPVSFMHGSDGSKPVYDGGVFSVQFTKEQLGNNFYSVVIPKQITPKNEIAEKEWAVTAAQANIISKRTAHDMMGIISPEDELKLIEEEQLNPAFNPDGAQKILASAQSLNQPATVGAAPNGPQGI